METTPKKELQIKPCPFCGSTEIRFDKCTLRVRCKKCFANSGIITRFANQGMSDEDAALMAWNTREYEKTD